MYITRLEFVKKPHLFGGVVVGRTGICVRAVKGSARIRLEVFGFAGASEGIFESLWRVCDRLRAIDETCVCERESWARNLRFGYIFSPTLRKNGEARGS